MKNTTIVSQMNRVFRIFRFQAITDAVISIVAALAIIVVALPTGVQADIQPTDTVNVSETVVSENSVALPSINDSEALWTINIPLTAYSSEPGQTDDTPFLTASQTHVRDGVVAANFLPIGTRVKIPALFGDKIFIVEDRMNARYDKKMDIWMDQTSDAIKFGLRHATVEIYPTLKEKKKR